MNNATAAIKTHFATSWTFTAPNGFTERYTTGTVATGMSLTDCARARENMLALEAARVLDGWTVVSRAHFA